MRYYIAENGKPAGPFEPNELLQHGLTVNSLVWCDGMADWAMASQVPELMTMLSGQPINSGGYGAPLPNTNIPFPPVGVPQPQQAPQGFPAPQPPVGNQPWNQPQYAPNPQPGRQMPKTWLTESVIVTVVSALCCCNFISLIIGIVAIIKAKSVKTKFQNGDVTGADSASESAKKWVIIAAVILVVWGIVQAYRTMTDPTFLQQIQEGAFGAALFGV